MLAGGGRALSVRRALRRGASGWSSAVFVHNLNYDVSEAVLQKHFRQAGEVVQAQINTDRRKRSRGTAVVTFASPAGAESAIARLNGTKLYGREVMIREDRGGVEIASKDAKSGLKGVSDEGSVMKTVFVGNLNKNVTDTILQSHMEAMGSVVKASVLRASLGESLGCGIVEYERIEDAMKAKVEMYNTILNGRLIFVREDREAKSSNILSSDLKSSHERKKRTCVMLGNVADVAKKSPDEVMRFLERVGPVKKIHFGERLVGKGRGKILVEYVSDTSALRAVAELHGTELIRKKVTIQRYGK